MLKFTRIFFIFAALACGLTASGSTMALGQTLGQIDNQLSQRESRFAQSSFHWQSSTDEIYPAVAPALVAARKKAIAKFLKSQRYPAKGISQNLAAFDATLYTRSSHDTEPWQINDLGDRCVVSAATVGPPPGSVKEKFTELIDGAKGAVLIEAASSGNEKLHQSPPVVWKSPGEAFRYPSPFQEGPDLWPIDFALLAGKDSLKVYGASWKIVHQSASDVTVSSSVTSGNFAPFEIQEVLDPKESYLPSQVILTSPRWSYVYTCKEYTMAGSDLVPKVVDATWNVRGVMMRHRVWSLSGVSSSAAEPLPIPARRLPTCSDYRLLGANLTMADVIRAEQRSDPLIARYVWRGVFPTEHQLKHLSEMQDRMPTKQIAMGMIVWVPGALLVLLGGMWYWQVRKSTGAA